MNNKKETVQAFLDLHKNEFLPMPDYVTIFSNMIGGVYGECRQVFDDKQLYELEISGDETKSGNPVLFTFRDHDHTPVSYQWQVSYESENSAAFGLDVFDDEMQAADRAQELNTKGEKGISLTKLENNAAIDVWKWVDDGWE